MKNFFLTFVVLIMIFFKSPIHAEYEKKFFDFKINGINNQIINLGDFKDKVVLVVNTASYCGFTKQYQDLQDLWEQYESKGLVVLGVPSNSFNQEKKDNFEVKNFCEVNFNINFPLTEITDVRGENAHEIFLWAKENFGKSAVPKWNFHKILINLYLNYHVRVIHFLAIFFLNHYNLNQNVN